jgi:uncharacterized membrane protein
VYGVGTGCFGTLAASHWFQLSQGSVIGIWAERVLHILVTKAAIVEIPKSTTKHHLLPAMFRGLLSVCLATTVLSTWPLWQARDFPPLLPVADFWQCNLGWPLLAACGLLAVLPRLGLATCWIGFSLAMLLDQTRIQPQVLSMLMLSLATINWQPGVLAARASLVSLWLFAGIHKLISPAYYQFFVPWLLGPEWDSAAGVAVAASLALGEIALGIGCLVPATRRLVAFGGVLIHLAALVLLSPIGLSWNSAVWPWNLALAAASLAIVLPWGGWAMGECWQESPNWVKAWAVGLLVMPMGYYVGIVDPYLAGCVYAYNTPRAFICTPFDRTEVGGLDKRWNVPLPPAPRLFKALFLQVGRPGTWVEIEDPRWCCGGTQSWEWQQDRSGPPALRIKKAVPSGGRSPPSVY